jgi:hypothetical protein
LRSSGAAGSSRVFLSGMARNIGLRPGAVKPLCPRR